MNKNNISVSKSESLLYWDGNDGSEIAESVFDMIEDLISTINDYKVMNMSLMNELRDFAIKVKYLDEDDIQIYKEEYFCLLYKFLDFLIFVAESHK